MTLYLKYRPQKISELDLESSREALLSLIKNKEIPHAFLFTGPKGTGKTSSARILAKAINCEKNKEKMGEPCNECAACKAISAGNFIDVIEMDAASNRGIDEIRALKQEIMLSPSVAHKKIYIIDEVHMLTSEAANAFLKTLEEPPSHVVFILATTDAHKLPQTILSRLSVVNFKKATVSEIELKLKKISESEKFTCDTNVLKKIATAADGSFRDAVKMLETLSLTSKEITSESFDKVFLDSADECTHVHKLVIEGETKAACTYLKELENRGVDGKSFLNNLITFTHLKLMDDLSATSELRLVELLLEAKSRIAYSPDEYLPIEIAFVKFMTPKIVSEEIKQPKKNETVSNSEHEEKAPIIETKKEPVGEAKFDEAIWNTALGNIRQKNASVEGLLRATKPLSYTDGKLQIGVYFQFHKEKLETASNKTILESVLSELVGKGVNVDYCLTARDVSSLQADSSSLTESSAPDIIKAAEEIFGS